MGTAYPTLATSELQVLETAVIEREDWGTPESTPFTQQYREIDHTLLLMGWPVDHLVPLDLEYLLNFVSGWKENGVSNLFYTTQIDHDAGFELKVDIDYGSKKEGSTLKVGEIYLIERSCGAAISVTSIFCDPHSIDQLIDELLDFIIEGH